MPAERLYYDASTLTDFRATVTDIRERSRADGASLWQIALDRTAFYPTSGGQPHDLGTLAATAPSGAVLEAPIVGVDEDAEGEVWHLTPKPLLAGTAVTGHIDWARRHDHMQQHSGQHLLSALFAAECDAPTLSFHLGDRVSTIDLDIASLTAEQLAAVERRANAIVAEARPVSLRTVSAERAQAMLAGGLLRKLPERAGAIRLVVIPGDGPEDEAGTAEDAAGRPALDLNACGGTHVRRTSQIGAVLLRGTERIRQSVRVSFLCGDRAIAAAREDDRTLTLLGQELSAGRPDLRAALTKTRQEARDAAKERKTLREELANYHATRLLVEDQPRNDLRIVRRVFRDRDFEYVKLLASRVAGAAPHTIALLASTQQPPTSPQSPAFMVLTASEDLGLDAASLLRTALEGAGGRGGGSASLAQGQLPVERVEGALATLEEQLRRRGVGAETTGNA